MSGRASRQKGQRAERAVVAALRRAGWIASSARALSGGMQRGEDIVWNGPASIEVKDHATMDLSGWLRQAQQQADGRPAVVVHKRRGKGEAEDWYVTTDVRTLLALLEGARPCAKSKGGTTDGAAEPIRGNTAA